VRTTAFQSAAGGFEVASRTVKLDGLRLTLAAQEAEVSGTVDFQRSLDLRVRWLPRTLASSVPVAPGSDSRVIRVGGTLEAPQVMVIEEAPGKAPAPAKQPKSPAR
jgi:autotransporter translocation and assembly factor TamB